MWCCLRDPTFSHSDTILACGGQIHRQIHTQTHDNSIYHSSIVLHGKKCTTVKQMNKLVGLKIQAYSVIKKQEKLYMYIQNKLKPKCETK